ncbi:hypothetical protein EG327_006534 [Venturia inaequalis]|uniref:Uncharacterized protein n=1 Tax=Venturia inaequalis TaxID=5025 RepID=A0A8H3YZZ3_VENIN|nr:hypothetical protein EG327_006534 [Venturia inaequalis]
MSENSSEEDQRPLTPDLEIGGVSLEAKEGLMINRPIKRYTESEMDMIRAALSPKYWPEGMPKDIKQRINNLMKPLQLDRHFSEQANQHTRQNKKSSTQDEGKIWRASRFQSGTGAVFRKW